MTKEAIKPTTPAAGVAQTLAAETRRKRRLIGSSLWPKARLFAEILYHQIDRDRTFTEASALTYKTLFSLLPIFVLSLLVLSSISAGGGKNALDRAVQQMIFQQLSLDTLPVFDAQGQPMTKTVHGQQKDLMLSDFVGPLIDRAKDSVTNRATGIIALAVLLYGAISLMFVIEGSFNQIYGAVKPRSWPQRTMLYWCVLTLGPIGIGASIALGNSAYLSAATYVGTGPAHWIVAPLQIFSSLIISFLLVLLLFKLIPNTQVNWKSALLGSLLAAVLWEICKWGFSLYVQKALRASWYGSLALIPFFMFWIYLVWSAILIGLHIAYMHQYWTLLKRRFFFTRMGATALSDLRWVLSLGILLHKRFKEGKSTKIHEAAELLMLPTDVTGQLLEALAMAGLIHATRANAYSLARPSESITAFDLLVAARSLTQVPPELTRESPSTQPSAQSPALPELDTLENTWAKSKTLPQLAGDPPASKQNP